MRRKSKKRKGVEFPFYFYFPRELREMSKQDGRLHALLKRDANAPRTRRRALSYLEKGKALYHSRPAWDLGFGYSFHLRMSYMEDPKSEYCADVDDLLRKVLSFVLKQDGKALAKSALCFFDKYPVFEGFYGYVPLISRGIEVRPLFFICRNCGAVTHWRPGNVWKEPTCCEDPWIERVCEVVLRHVGELAITARRMGGYKDALQKLFRTEFGERQALERTTRERRPRLEHGEKSGTRQARLERSKLGKKLVREITDRIPQYRKEIEKVVKDSRYDSLVIRRLRKVYRDLAVTRRTLLEEVIQQDLDQCASEHSDIRFPSAATLLKRGKRGSK